MSSLIEFATVASRQHRNEPAVPVGSPMGFTIDTRAAQAAQTTLAASPAAAASAASAPSTLSAEFMAHQVKLIERFACLYNHDYEAEFGLLTHFGFTLHPAIILWHAAKLFAPSSVKTEYASGIPLSELFIDEWTSMAHEDFLALIASVPDHVISRQLQESLDRNIRKGITKGEWGSALGLCINGSCISAQIFRENFRILIQCYGVAILPKNSKHNFQRRILPQESTRVKLPEEAYFHANYCHQRKMIVCQAPSQSQESEQNRNFYRMLWENDCTAIAMVTKYVEDSPVHTCSHYLESHQETDPIQWKSRRPSPFTLSAYGTAYFKKMGITFTPEELAQLEKLNITITEISLHKGNKIKRVLHFHLPTWLSIEKNSSETIHSIAALAHMLLKMKMPVIHCLGGQGRSGVLASIIIAYRKIQEFIEQRQDIPSTLIKDVVENLREERDYCIANANQYQTIFDVLKVMLNLPA